MINEEIIDIYNEFKNKTGRTKIRNKEKLEIGEYILGVQAIIINSENQILITKRSEFKKAYPLKWECNGGAVLAGEDSLDGLVREMTEELGINLNKEEALYLKTVKTNNNIKDIYLVKKDIEINDLKFDDGEVVDAKWVDINEYMNMFNSGEIVPNVDFIYDDYEKSMEIFSNICKCK